MSPKSTVCDVCVVRPRRLYMSGVEWETLPIDQGLFSVIWRPKYGAHLFIPRTSWSLLWRNETGVSRWDYIFFFVTYFIPLASIKISSFTYGGKVAYG